MNVDVRKILLVDDNPKDVELIMNALAEKNLANDIIVAEDGEEALDFLHLRGKFANREKGNPAIILLDIQLPQITGIETLKQIRSEPAFKLIPVIMVTSSREEKDLMESYKLGANSYVVKPINILQFMESIKVLGQYWAIVNQPPPNYINGVYDKIPFFTQHFDNL